MQATGVKGFRLSTQQTRVWALQQQGAAYYSLIAVYLEGKLDNRALLHALQKLVDRHDILRTSFFCPPNMDVPLQVVAAAAEVACRLIDLERLSTSRQTLAVERCVAALRCQVASLEKTSLLLSMVLRLQQQRSVLFLCLPALCADSFAL